MMNSSSGAGPSNGGSGDGDTPRRASRKPKYSKFTQQELPACKPILTPKWVISVFVLVGAIFVPIGVASLLASQKVVEIVDRYDDACMSNVTDKLAYIQNFTTPKTCHRTLKLMSLAACFYNPKILKWKKLTTKQNNPWLKYSLIVSPGPEGYEATNLCVLPTE